MDTFGQELFQVMRALHVLGVIVLFAGVLAGAILMFAVATPRWKRIQLIVGITSASYLFTFVYGMLLYPVFRVTVRAVLLDPSLPHGTGIFEIKEHLAALGAFLALTLLTLSIFGRLRRTSVWRRQLFAGLFTMFAIISTTLIVLAYTLSGIR